MDKCEVASSPAANTSLWDILLLALKRVTARDFLLSAASGIPTVGKIGMECSAQRAHCHHCLAAYQVFGNQRLSARLVFGSVSFARATKVWYLYSWTSKSARQTSSLRAGMPCYSKHICQTRRLCEFRYQSVHS